MISWRAQGQLTIQVFHCYITDRQIFGNSWSRNKKVFFGVLWRNFFTLFSLISPLRYTRCKASGFSTSPCYLTSSRDTFDSFLTSWLFFVINRKVAHNYHHKRNTHKFNNEYSREGRGTMQTKSYWLTFYSLAVFYVPPGLTLKNSTWCLFCVECFVGISEQTATFALYIIKLFVIITMVESVYSTVRTDSLNRADYV
jgi:hypothetical protein